MSSYQIKYSLPLCSFHRCGIPNCLIYQHTHSAPSSGLFSVFCHRFIIRLKPRARVGQSALQPRSELHIPLQFWLSSSKPPSQHLLKSSAFVVTRVLRPAFGSHTVCKTTLRYWQTQNVSGLGKRAIQEVTFPLLYHNIIGQWLYRMFVARQKGWGWWLDLVSEVSVEVGWRILYFLCISFVIRVFLCLNQISS